MVLCHRCKCAFTPSTRTEHEEACARFQRAAQHAPPENYFAARDKDRVGIRYRPGSVPQGVDVAPSSETATKWEKDGYLMIFYVTRYY